MRTSALLGLLVLALLCAAVRARAKDGILLPTEKMHYHEADAIVFHDRHARQELVQILHDMGFDSVARRLMASDLLIGGRGPFTIFAPTEQAFHGRRLSEQALANHIVQGLFTYADLKAMPCGSYLDGILNDLAITTTSEDGVSVNGVPVSPTDYLPTQIPLLVIHAVEDFLVAPDDDDFSFAQMMK